MEATTQTNENQYAMDHPPRVTVGVPVFNGERFVAEALDSILGQTFQDFEIVISDNGSTDRTEYICRSYASRDPRVRYYRNEANRGAAWNHNRVFELARGQYFKWWSHDDLCAPEFLEECVAVLDRDPGVVLCFARTQIIDADRRPVTKYIVPAMTRMDSRRAYQRFHGAICPDHWCFEVYGVGRTDVLRQTHLIANYTASDRVLLAELALRGRFYEIPACRLFNRDHQSRSIQVHSIYTVGGWFDPKLKGKITLPHWRYLGEYAKIVSGSALTRWERLCCYAQLLPYCCRWRKELLTDLGMAARSLYQRAFVRAAGSMPPVAPEA